MSETPEFQPAAVALLKAAAAGRQDDTVRRYLGRVDLVEREVVEAVLAARKGGERGQALEVQLARRTDAAAIYQALLDIPPDVDLPDAFGDRSAPPLPEAARVAASPGESACPWLDRYIEFSRRWAPRAYNDYHEAVGVFVLSAVAARRIYCNLGDRRYPSIYLALLGKTSLYTKTTARKIGTRLIEDARLDWLIGPDDCTPQRLVYDLTPAVPDDYDSLGPDRQEWCRNRAALPAQRGFFLEEFGKHLASMMREGSAYADFLGLLRQMDDGTSRYVSATIARGVSNVENPYLSILANMTPQDLRPFAHRGSALWGNGFLARFGLVCPPPGYRRNRDRFPAGEMVMDRALVRQLIDWHNQLGMPDVTISDAATTDRRTKTKKAEPGPIHQREYPLDPEVYEAFFAYSDSLLDMVETEAVPEDLAGNYARFPEKALRMALLFASVSGDDKIRMRHWARAQEIAERWREGLHNLYNQVNDSEPSHDRMLEERILEIMGKHFSGHGATAAKLKPYIRNVSTGEIGRLLDAMEASGELASEATKRNTKKYRFAVQEDDRQ